MYKLTAMACKKQRLLKIDFKHLLNKLFSEKSDTPGITFIRLNPT